MHFISSKTLHLNRFIQLVCPVVAVTRVHMNSILATVSFVSFSARAVEASSKRETRDWPALKACQL